MAAPIGWSVSGKAPEDYEVALDPKHSHCGTRSALIRARVEQPKDFVTLTQSIAADEHRGKRLRMSAWVRTENVEHSCWLWMRFDDGGGNILALDNMHKRLIRGTTDWSKHDLVMDVPTAAHVIHFGIALHGSGAAWLDDVAFDVVGPEVSTTLRQYPAKPRNLDFEA